MTIQLIIDNREQKLIELLNKQNTTTYIQKQLDIGDIVFQDENNETILVIERKTINDLKCSIIDGRAREQKARLLGSGTPVERIMYIIEGNVETNNSLPTNTVVGSMINTQLRDGIKVYRTYSIEETVNFICKLLDKLKTDIDKYFKNGKQDISYAETLKKSKKANMTPELWFVCQLSLIPQVSENIATEISKNYPTLKNLIDTYIKTPEHLQPILLSDIKITEKRKLGNKLSERIYYYFYKS